MFSSTASSFYKTPHPSSTFDADDFRYLLHAVFCCRSLKLVSVIAAASTSSSRHRFYYSDRYGKLFVNKLPSFFSSLFLPYDCWWDCVALPDDIDSSDEDSFKMQIKELAFKIDLKLKVCRDSSTKKVLVQEATLFGVKTVILGTSVT
ncbi:hypothetical protein Ahy_Scaffold6g108003 [Arachis hypogaea]|uniref:Uncharacterized protein n=1 Tax=Arachis hypogaea TaxID=3818 RepID=A0A444WP45_ARAHY|nr:hypothetical protein Ahy_Scaffold6g108003 [Arachis hypogaea]